MVQVARVTLPANTKFAKALTAIFGIGPATGLEIAESCGISRDVLVEEVSPAHLQRVSQFIEDNYTIGDQLKRNIREDILQLISIKSRRGSRHELGLSISGNTKSNNSTAKKLRHHLMYDTSKQAAYRSPHLLITSHNALLASSAGRAMPREQSCAGAHPCLARPVGRSPPQPAAAHHDLAGSIHVRGILQTR